MKRLLYMLVVVALTGGVAAFVGTAHAKAAFDPVPGWLAPVCFGQVSDDPFEDEECEVEPNVTPICVDNVTYFVANDDSPGPVLPNSDMQEMIDGINSFPPHHAFAGACPPPPPKPGASGIKMCNTHYPSDPPIIVAAFDPYLPALGDPAKAAAATGDWTYASLLKSGGTKKFTCVLPSNAVATGNVADDNDDEIPAALAATLHALGYAETLTYPVFTA